MSISNNSNDYKTKKLKSRMPIIPINLDNIEASTRGEVILDFDGKKIMAKRPNSDEIVDFTGDIQQVDKDNSITAEFSAGNHPLPHRYRYDERSIDSSNKLIRLLNFEDADSNYIPFKNGDGYLEWGYVFDVIKSNMCRNVQIASVVNNGILILESGNIYKTSALSGDVHVKILQPETDYSRILWYLSTATCNIIFDDNVSLSDAALISDNSTVSLIIETWDRGATWYITSENSSYNKSDINNTMSWGYEDNGITELVGIYKMRSMKTLDGYINSTKDNNTFYFIEETSQIYRGSKLFTSPYILCTEFPTTNIATGKLYINTTTREIKVYENSAWSNILAVASVISLAVEDKALVTKKALLDYLVGISSTNPITDTVGTNIVSVDGLQSAIKSTISNATTYDKLLPNIAAVKKYVAEIVPTGTYVKKIESLANIGIKATLSNDTTVDIPITTASDITSTSLDVANKVIKLNRADGDFYSINLAELFDEVGMVLSDSATISIGQIGDDYVANVNISTQEGNQISAKEDGLYCSGGSSLPQGESDKILVSTQSGIDRSDFSIVTEVDTTVEEDKVVVPLSVLYPSDINKTNANTYYDTIDLDIYDTLDFAVASYDFNMGEITTSESTITISKSSDSTSSETITSTVSGIYDNNIKTFVNVINDNNVDDDLYYYYKFDLGSTKNISTTIKVTDKPDIKCEVQNPGVVILYVPVNVIIQEAIVDEADVTFSYTAETTSLTDISITGTAKYTDIDGSVKTFDGGIFVWKYSYTGINPNEITDENYIVYIQYNAPYSVINPVTIGTKLLSHKAE